MDHSTSSYNTEKVRLTLHIAGSCKQRFKVLCEMFSINESTLFSLIVNEMYYEPLSPTLPKTVNTATQRVFQFFRQSDPAWKNQNERF